MSVLIQGLEMPTSCAACKFRTSYNESLDPFTDYCFLTNARLGYFANDRAKWQKQRKKNCPLDYPCNDCPLTDIGGAEE